MIFSEKGSRGQTINLPCHRELLGKNDRFLLLGCSGGSKEFTCHLGGTLDCLGSILGGSWGPGEDFGLRQNG